MSDYKVINDNGYERTWEELYEDNVRFQKYTDKLETENQKYKEVIDKAIELIESKNNGVCVINGKEKEAFTFLLDFDKAR